MSNNDAYELRKEIRQLRMENDALWGELEGLSAFRKLRQKENLDPEFFQVVFESNPLGTLLLDDDWRPLRANRAFFDLFGYTQNEILSQHYWNFLEKGDDPDFREHLKKRERTIISDAEYRYRKKDCSLFWGRTDISVLRNINGEILYSVVMIADITKTKNDQLALESSRKRLELHIEQTMVGVIECGADLCVTEWNQGAEKLFGYGKNEAMGDNVLDLVRPEFGESFSREKANEQLLRINDSRQRIVICTNKSGKKVICEWHITPIMDENDDLISFATICRDISTEVEHREMLERSERRLRSIVEAIPIPVAIESLETSRFLFANEPFAQLAGLDLPELEELRRTAVLLDKATNAKVRNIAMTKGEATSLLLEGKRGNGEPVWLNTSMRILDFMGEKSVFLTAVDLTDSYRYQEELAKLAAVVEASEDFIALADPETRNVIYLNSAGKKLTGVEAKEDLKITSVLTFHPEEHRSVLDDLWKSVSQGENWDGEVDMVHFQTGKRIPTYFRAFPVLHPRSGEQIAVAAIAMDLTDAKLEEQERRRFEEQIQHVQRLEGLGVLAGGIAHDFNNLLLGILGNASLAGEELAHPSKVKQFLNNIIASARHATELTNQMLTYSGKAAVVTTPLLLSDLVQDTENLIRMGVKKHIKVSFDFAPNTPPIIGDPTQIRQVLMNLAINASDAIEMADVHDGKIEFYVGLMNVDVDAQNRILFGQTIELGDYVSLRVVDNGCGIDENTREKIFDPFYTTKFTGRGLGLATVYGIMRGHKGGILVESIEEHGSAFTMLFPVGDAEVKQEEKEILLSDEDLLNKSYSGIALIVDDEEPIRFVASAMFERHGFEILTASDGVEAVEIFKEHNGQISLVFLDMMMPRMGGDGAMREIRKLDGDVAIVLTSGYSEKEISSDLKNENYLFIQKPFTPEDLAAIVWKAMV